MKIKILFLMISITFLCYSCRQGKTNKNDMVNNTLNVKIDSVDFREITDNKIDDNRLAILKIDTTMECFQIYYLIKENEDTICKTGVDSKGNSLLLKYPDRSVFLTLKQDGNTILSNKEILKKDFESIIPHEEIKNYQLWSFTINDVDEQRVYFHVNICIPDTDLCYLIELSISSEGKFSLQEIDEGEMGD